MVIANPISDTAFKFLMSDSRIAKFFIETILEQELLEVDLKPQELPYNKPNDQLRLAASIAVFRLDFIATIKTTDNEYKKVLIEIQKARKYSDITRFRNYLGEHYKKTDEINTPDGLKKAVLPIITIYLLGFNLPEINTAVVKVGRVYLDQINHTVINEKNEFIEKLTHDCFVVQIPRIESKVQSRLEKLLSVFEQNYFVDEDGMIKDYPYAMNEEPMKHIIDTLHFIGTDPERRSWLATEKEAYRVFYEDLEGLENEVKETKKALEEKDKALQEKESTNQQLLKELAELKRKMNL